jgi:hypothetical protein
MITEVAIISAEPEDEIPGEQGRYDFILVEGSLRGFCGTTEKRTKTGLILLSHAAKNFTKCACLRNRIITFLKLV